MRIKHFARQKVTLVQQGFTIAQVDVAAGLIKAIRSLQDPKRSTYSYLITASVDITGQPSGRSTTVTVAASQQTALHKDSEKYFHLLGSDGNAGIPICLRRSTRITLNNQYKSTDYG